MTNNELNRKVAELRHGQWPADHCPVCGWVFSPNHEYGCVPESCSMRPTPAVRAIDAAIPDYCTDPAAWGALFVALAEDGQVVHLLYEPEYKAYAARIGRIGSAYCVFGDDPLPGRALCLALLASVEGR